MHELTLLFGVAEQIERVVRDNGIEKVDAVVLEVGELTSVVPAFLRDGYEVVSDEFDFLRGSELIIETVAGMARCGDCGTEYEVAPHEGICPMCGSKEKVLTAGTDFVIKEVRIIE